MRWWRESATGAVYAPFTLPCASKPWMPMASRAISIAAQAMTDQATMLSQFHRLQRHKDQRGNADQHPPRAGGYIAR